MQYDNDLLNLWVSAHTVRPEQVRELVDELQQARHDLAAAEKAAPAECAECWARCECAEDCDDRGR